MFPNAPQSQQPLPPASLPALPVQPGQTPLAAGSVPAAGAAAVPALAQPGTASTEEATLQARQLVERPGQSPYQLAEAFAQLKSNYLARQHHITSNPAGN